MNCILEGKIVTLVPMEDCHKAELISVLLSPKVWEYTWRTIHTTEELDQVLTDALANKNNGSQIPFTILDQASGKIIGTTRVGDLDMANRNAEIGWTWLSPDYWRTGVNTECKFLLLRHCFEELHLMRVQFSVSGQNIRSQRSIERIGAIKEGVFRKHRIKADGSMHDNIFYSILDNEWADVKENLLFLLSKKYS
ncbi:MULTISPECIES: GNAT family N-acetyltransferase [Paenibacillus]|uniref:GNAT family protein n=1 Tax=Paenibacillus urinalis TaxID=521520 RepID=A0AAX3N2N1_9BACL|nr:MULTISPECIES: GNAT family protein [Paenibacillus]WDH83558.1 GNAT family protein [Paenibacillus urinalis]